MWFFPQDQGGMEDDDASMDELFLSYAAHAAPPMHVLRPCVPASTAHASRVARRAGFRRH